VSATSRVNAPDLATWRPIHGPASRAWKDPSSQTSSWKRPINPRPRGAQLKAINVLPLVSNATTGVVTLALRNANTAPGTLGHSGACAAAAGFNYGGVLVLYASTVGRVFGVERVGQVYGLLFTANIVAAPAPVVCGLVFDRFGSFTPALLVLAVLMLAAARGVVLPQKPGTTT